VAALLMLLVVAAHGEGVGEMEMPVAEPQDPLPVIVYLAVVGATAGVAVQAGPDAIKAVRTVVMERLQEVLSAPDFAAVRTFGNFPAIALSASPDVIALLLAMPEVDSIGRDPELMPLEDVKLDFN
jgi:hypothetical protein